LLEILQTHLLKVKKECGTPPPPPPPVSSYFFRKL
jgi:hypothetical protein